MWVSSRTALCGQGGFPSQVSRLLPPLSASLGGYFPTALVPGRSPVTRQLTAVVISIDRFPARGTMDGLAALSVREPMGVTLSIHCELLTCTERVGLAAFVDGARGVIHTRGNHPFRLSQGYIHVAQGGS